MDDRMLTQCVRCGAQANLTTAETIAWMDVHGPGRCEKKLPEKE